MSFRVLRSLINTLERNKLDSFSDGHPRHSWQIEPSIDFEEIYLLQLTHAIPDSVAQTFRPGKA